MSTSSVGTYIVDGLKISIKILQDISGDLPPPTASVVNLIKRVIEAIETIQSNKDLCDLLRDRLLRLLPVVMMAIRKSAGGSKDESAIPQDLRQAVERFQEDLEAILTQVEDLQAVVKSKRRRHKIKAFFKGDSHASTLQKCSDDLDWAIKQFEVSSRLTSAVHLFEVTRKVQSVLTNQFLESLPRAKYAGFDCERPDRPANCFEGTRTILLETITEWITNPDPAIARFFWLKGIAGVGKTTVARTIAELSRKTGLLGAQFFFSRRGEAELRNPALVFPTIAYQLARFDPEFSERITAALEADPEAPFASLNEQLNRLIIKPLSGLDRDPKRVVLIVFDAFDECEARGAKEILQLLVAAMPSLPFFLKILVTSRPEVHISSVLDPSPTTLPPSSSLRISALHDIEASIVKSDILTYLRARLRGLPAERNLPLQPDWITDQEIELLAEKAGNLFIHAATSIRFLLEALDLRDQLDTLLRIVGRIRDPNAGGENPFVYLDELYLEILRGLITPTNGPEVVRTLQPVLGSIVLLRDPLPVDALERLIGLKKGKASTIFSLLQSVILPPAPPDHCPRIYHPSFPDFLQDAERCGDDRFRITTGKHEARFAVRCLELLNAKLHKGMLGPLDPALLNSEVENLEGKVRAAFPPELQYACRYWASHVAAAAEGDPSIIEALNSFAASSLLPWIEAMSWLGDVRLCLTSLEVMNSWVATSSCSYLTKSLFNDGHRLLLAHFITISAGAQHLARSVLPFIPRNVSVTSQYNTYSDTTVTATRGTDLEWPACLTVLTGQSPVYSVVFSPEGAQLASSHHDGKIRLWDATSGHCLITLVGHSERVNAAVFSPDGLRLASASSDNTLRIWDLSTGSCLTSLCDHSAGVNSVAFSPDGTQVISGSDDTTIRLWDTTTGTSIRTFANHFSHVMSVVYSPDGSQIACGSYDKTVRVYDVKAGMSVATLKSHSGAVMSVAFSPLHRRLASGSEDHTVRVWDTSTWSCIATLEGHTRAVTSLAYSPDGSQLVSGSKDETTRVWDTATGACLTILRGHNNVIYSVAFSTDGLRIASGSEDGNIRVWDTSAIAPTANPEKHSDWVHSVTFSQNGLRVASGSHDKTIRVWNANTGACILTLEGHSGPILSVTFSPDGSRLASGSQDCTIRLWDADAGVCMATSTKHPNGVAQVDFSPSGFHVTSRTTGDSVCVWDVLTGDRVESPTASMHVPSRQTNHQLQVQHGKLWRIDDSGEKHLLLIIPSFYAIRSTDFFTFDAGMTRIALGSEDGSVLILEVVLA